MGTFKTHRAAVADAKSNLFCDWFNVYEFADGTWEYISPFRRRDVSGYVRCSIYQLARYNGRWRMMSDAIRA